MAADGNHAQSEPTSGHTPRAARGSLYILPFTRRAVTLVACLERRGPLVIIGSKEPITSHCRELGANQFLSPYEVHRHVREGGAQRTFVSFPEMVGAGTASSALVPFAGELLSFSTIELWLVLNGFEPIAARTTAFGYRLERFDSRFDDGAGVEARIALLFARLEREIAYHARDHLCPSAIRSKTATGASAALADVTRDMIALARLLRIGGINAAATNAFVRQLQHVVETLGRTG